jgi:hypothetical protein
MIGVLVGTGQIDSRPPISRSVGLQKIYIGSLDMFAVMNVAADKARWPTVSFALIIRAMLMPILPTEAISAR